VAMLRTMLDTNGSSVSSPPGEEDGLLNTFSSRESEVDEENERASNHENDFYDVTPDGTGLSLIPDLEKGKFLSLSDHSTNMDLGSDSVSNSSDSNSDEADSSGSITKNRSLPSLEKAYRRKAATVRRLEAASKQNWSLIKNKPVPGRGFFLPGWGT